jgi:hypothetical protein
VTFNATVASHYGSIPDGGIVKFFDGSAELAAVPVSGGIAAYTTSTLSAKKHTITATYVGDSKFAAITKKITQVVE